MLSELKIIFSGYLNIADRWIKLQHLFCLFCVKGCRMCRKSTKSPKGLLQQCAAFSASISSKLYLLKARSLEETVYMQRWRLCVTPRGKWQTVCNLILTSTSVRSQRISLTNRTWHISCTWFYYFFYFLICEYAKSKTWICLLPKKDDFKLRAQQITLSKRGTNAISTLINSIYSFICVTLKYFCYVPVLFTHLNFCLMQIFNVQMFSGVKYNMS